MDFVVVNDNVVSFSINSWLAVLITAAVGYLLGSTNWAIIVTRLFAHEDIRNVGSGNAGATNVLRSQGVFLAILTLIGDVGKGILAAFAGGWIMSWVQLSPGDSPLVTYESLILLGQYIAGLFVVVGHLYPVFHGFRGGKGVAATMGLLFVLDWRMALMCVGMFILTVAVSRMVSLGSVLALSYVPVLTFLFRYSVDDMAIETVIFCTVVSAVVALIVIFKHGSNMRRIANGTERRIGEEAHAEAEAAVAETTEET